MTDIENGGRGTWEEWRRVVVMMFNKFGEFEGKLDQLILVVNELRTQQYQIEANKKQSETNAARIAALEAEKAAQLAANNVRSNIKSTASDWIKPVVTSLIAALLTAAAFLLIFGVTP